MADMQPSAIDALQRRRVLDLTTVGRNSGQPRTIEIWFVVYQGRFYLFAEHGYGAHWVLNIQANPDVSVRVREQRFRARGRILNPDQDPVEWQTVADLVRQKYGWGEGLPVAIEVVAAETVEER